MFPLPSIFPFPIFFFIRFTSSGGASSSSSSSIPTPTPTPLLLLLLWVILVLPRLMLLSDPFPTEGTSLPALAHTPREDVEEEKEEEKVLWENSNDEKDVVPYAPPLLFDLLWLFLRSSLSVL